MQLQIKEDLAIRFPSRQMNLLQLPDILYPRHHALINHSINQVKDTERKTAQTIEVFPTFNQIQIIQSKQYKYRSQSHDQNDKDIFDQILSGKRYKIEEGQMNEINLPKIQNTLHVDKVRVNSFQIDKNIALPQFLEKTPISVYRTGKALSIRSTLQDANKKIKRYSDVDDIIDRVRLQQIDILKKYNAKNFSKEIQGKLRDELLNILKSFKS